MPVFWKFQANESILLPQCPTDTPLQMNIPFSSSLLGAKTVSYPRLWANSLGVARKRAKHQWTPAWISEQDTREKKGRDEEARSKRRKSKL